MPGKRKPIPRFASEAEERAFRETHGSVAYLDWSKARRVRLDGLIARRNDGASHPDMVETRMSRQSPIVSEFPTTEVAEAHDRWVCDKVRRGLADPRPTTPHDDVMAEIDEIIATAGQKAAE